MIRILRDNIQNNLGYLKQNIKGEFTFITGVSAYPEIVKSADIIMEANSNIKINCLKTLNKFLGETITVAGLLTGRDILHQSKKVTLYKNVVIPVNMLRSGENIFLDDMTVEQLENELKRNVLICEYTGEDLIDIINSNSEEE